MAKRRRRVDDLHYIHVQVRAQQKSNLKALAKANDISGGEVVDKLIKDAVARLERRKGRVLQSVLPAA